MSDRKWLSPNLKLGHLHHTDVSAWVEIVTLLNGRTGWWCKLARMSLKRRRVREEVEMTLRHGWQMREQPLQRQATANVKCHLYPSFCPDNKLA